MGRTHFELTRRSALRAGAGGLTAAMAAGVPRMAAAGPGTQHEVQPEAQRGSRLLTRITPAGARITTVLVDVGQELLGCRDLVRAFTVAVNVDGGSPRPCAVLRAYTRSTATPGEAESGSYVVLELAGRDDELVEPYRLERGGLTPLMFREYAPDGTVVQKPRVQATTTPRALDEALSFTVSRVASVVAADGGMLAASEWSFTAAAPALDERDLAGFEDGAIAGTEPANVLRYRFRRPGTRSPAPLVVFLHGSGQVGSDNLAHVLSSRGAVGVLEHEDCYVVAPQLSSVFDAYDTYDEATGTGGGIHWQSRNRRYLVVALVRRLLREHPGIDRHRVYVHGLSRGAEGALALVLDEPQLFAAALLASGREAGTVEWLDGHATPDLLRPALGTPLWFFHARQDTVSPVSGTRTNVEILRQLGHTSLRYTELDYERPGDSGYVNTSAHNSWDLAYNSPEVWRWLLAQGPRRRG